MALKGWRNFFYINMCTEETKTLLNDINLRSKPYSILFYIVTLTSENLVL